MRSTDEAGDLVIWVGWWDEEKKSYDFFSLSNFISVFVHFKPPPQLMEFSLCVNAKSGYS